MVSDFHTLPKKSILKWMGIVAVGLSAMASSAASQAITIDPGYDFLKTLAGTQFMGNSFHGVGFGTIDLGTIPGAQPPLPFSGVQNYGKTDTIVERTVGGTLTNPGDTLTTPTRMVALLLQSDTMIDLGAGAHYYYATLSDTQPIDIPPPNTGVNAPGMQPCVLAGLGNNGMCITLDNTLNGGTFISNLTFNIDLHQSISDNYMSVADARDIGGIAPNFSNLPLSLSSSCRWSGNFNILPECVETSATGDETHIIKTVPEPATLSLITAGIGLLGFRRRKAA